MLEIKNITKSYKSGNFSQKALNNISLKFRKNEFVSILGPSGSGKTTLLNIIGGLDRYDNGDLIIEGVSTKKYKDKNFDSYRNHRVGFIFQSYNLIMHQSVLQNVEIALTLSGVSKRERKRKAKEVLNRVGLKEHIHKMPNQLSGGQMQRVAIARALVNDPEIILADEPTGALDSTTSVQIMDLLKEIANDKLVIMVTHNPLLAKKYSNRIIELKDGLIIDDSNPFDENEEIVSNKKERATSMSFLSALYLSFNNLLTKKGRTFLTSFAGSIGIIGIALILSLSNGVNNYAHKLEKESLSDFPITIEKTSYDLFGSLANSFNDVFSNQECEEGKICSKDDVVKQSIDSSSKGIIKNNNTKEFKKYIDNNEEFKNITDNIEYTYNLNLQVYSNDYQKVNPSNILSVDNNNIFKELSNNKDKYELLKGKLPTNYNEIVLVVGDDNTVNDSIFYSLEIKDIHKLNEDIKKIKEDQNYKVSSDVFDYDDILNKTYKVILNTDYYKEENDLYIDYSNNTEYMKNKIDNGIEIKIVGVVKEKESLSSFIGYDHDLSIKIINEINKTSIFQKQMSNKNINVLNNLEFDNLNNTYEDIIYKLGLYEIDNPSNINIYPKDYNSKEKIIELIEKYNKEKKDNNEEELIITYSDLMKSLVSGITKVIDIISYVLIAFIAISLIVSSIMIAIITYISVLERTKEIGILRAIGASKKDIKRVFRAETIIEGLIAGCFGIAIAFLLTVLINSIVSSIANIDIIASIPLFGAISLIILSVLLNVIAGRKPSNMAAKKDPVEALRTE